jgi:small-conductance mechanosensitive channel
MSPLTAEASAREMTALAWRRTTLRWVVVAVVAARIFSDAIGRAVVIVAFVTIAAAALLSLAAARESRPDDRGTPPVRLGLVAAGTLVLALVALVWVLSQ